MRGEPVLWLNGSGHGRINNLVVPSDVAAGYAPAGQALISTTVIGEVTEPDARLIEVLRAELLVQHGEQTRTWRPLAVQRIRRALPALSAPIEGTGAAKEVRPGLWVCGDHVASASIQGAMASGEAVAAAIAGQERIP